MTIDCPGDWKKHLANPDLAMYVEEISFAGTALNKDTGLSIVRLDPNRTFLSTLPSGSSRPSPEFDKMRKVLGDLIANSPKTIPKD